MPFPFPPQLKINLRERSLIQLVGRDGSGRVGCLAQRDIGPLSAIIAFKNSHKIMQMGLMKNNSKTRAVVKVGVADKSPLVRAALKQIFSEDQRFDLVSVCPDGQSLIKTLESVQLDVCVIGWVIGPGDGRYILDYLQAYENSPRAVVFTGAENDTVPAQAMAHGAAAYVSKSEQPEFLLDTVAAVAKGRMAFPYLDVRKIHDNPLTSLTKRELEILSSVAAGRTNKEIAADKGLSPNTIKFHIKNLYEKLGVHNRSQAVALYLKS